MAAKTDWDSCSEEGAIGNDFSSNNASGFTALPGGYRTNAGGFIYLGLHAHWSSSTVRAENENEVWTYSMGNSSSGFGRGVGTNRHGFSVRLVKD